MDRFLEAALDEARQGLEEGGIPRVIIGENHTFMGEEEWLTSRGVMLEVLQDEECVRIMTGFIAEKPDLWNEDIGV